MASEGFQLIRNALTRAEQRRLLKAVDAIAREAPFYKPTMPRTGKPFSVRMTNAGSDPKSVESIIAGYLYSVWYRGDNTVENAKKPEFGNALDAKELYPDLKLRTIRDFLKEKYSA